MIKGKAIVLYSGGPDSYISSKWAQKAYTEVEILYYVLGHRYQIQELDAIKNTILTTRVQGDLSFMGRWETEDSFIYARNAFLVMAASRKLGSIEPGTIILTVQEDEMDMADRSKEFLKLMSKLITQLRGATTIVISPWETMDKTDMVRWYLKQGYDKRPLCDTHSCYSPEIVETELSKKLGILGEKLPCGNCPACFRRAVAFKLNGIEERYAQDPLASDTAKKYYRRAKEGKYSEKRCQRIFDALGVVK
jgi:7-cyano-7-deazaguanine synthase in queuosine biosynthesis